MGRKCEEARGDPRGRSRLDRLDKNEPVYLICQSGGRSKKAAEILNRNGFKWVFNVTGGTNEWVAEGLPMDPAAR